MSKVAFIKTELISTVNASAVMPLGILQLASVIRDEGHEAKILDLQVTRPGQIIRQLQKIIDWQPDLVGLSAISMQKETAMEVARFFRQNLPQSKIAIGGPLASSEAGGLLQEPAIDFVVQGEGEETIISILDAMQSHCSLQQVGNLSFRDHGTIRQNALKPLEKSLDDLPLYAWDMVDFNWYGRFLSQSMQRSKYAAIFTSRGCPYNCTYCHNIFGKKFRARGPENIMRELHLLYDNYGIRRIEIIDDIFNLDYERAYTVLERIKHELPGMTVGFPNGLRADLLDEKFLALMASIPTYLLIIPIETGSLRLQKMVKKNLKLDKALEAIRISHRLGIHTWAFFMMGFPTETEEELQKTFEIASMPEVDYPVIATVCPYEGTPLSESLGMDVDVPSMKQYDYYYGDFSLSELDPELINKQKYDLMRKRLFFKPANWYIMSNFIRWKIWWLGAHNMFVHFVMVMVDGFAKETTYSVKYLLNEREHIFKRLQHRLQSYGKRNK